MDHGAALLMQQGYHGVGLQEVVQSAGAAKGTFYNYSESKEAFGAEVVADMDAKEMADLMVNLWQGSAAAHVDRALGASR
jgi:TetR/AcrR family transcriptional repressor of nem operon